MKILNIFRNIRIRYLCRKYFIRNYHINEDGSVDVNGSVVLDHINLKKIPITFNRVLGDFWCQGNELTSFENFPKVIGGRLKASRNKINSLVGFPKFLNSPDRGWHQLMVRIDLSNNNIRTFDGVSNIYDGNGIGYINLNSNPINKPWNFINKNYDGKVDELLDMVNDYDIFREDEIIVDRLNELLQDLGRKPINRHEYRMFKYFPEDHRIIS
jgi:hypothetical protein